MKELYVIYTEIYGKVRSGNKIDRADYGEHDFVDGFKPYDERRHAAVTLAVQDVKNGDDMRGKAEVESIVASLVGDA